MLECSDGSGMLESTGSTGQARQDSSSGMAYWTGSTRQGRRTGSPTTAFPAPFVLLCKDVDVDMESACNLALRFVCAQKMRFRSGD
ncbi:hypothetical protein BDV97DRAFT_364096, partial [Delphinella strobiligena]